MDNQPPEPPPQPPQDYAARFRAEGAEPHASAPAGAGPAPGAAPAGTAAAAPPAAAPKPYSLAGLLETALVAPLRPWATFTDAAARPQPPALALAAVTAAYAALFFGMNLVHAAIAYPGALDAYPAQRFAAVGGAALLVMVLAGLTGAAAFHLLALACGGKGSFGRSYQAVALAAALLPAEAAALWWPPLVFLPVLLGAVVLAAALEGLHGVKPAAARVSCAVLAALSLAAGWSVKRRVDEALAPYVALQRTLNAAASAMNAPAAGSPAAAAAAAAGASAAPQGQSGLDMVAGPSETGGGALPSVAPGGPSAGGALPAGVVPGSLPALPTTPQQMQQVSQQSAALMGSLAPMIQASMANVKDPAQRAQLQQLSEMMTKVQGSMQSGRPLSAADRRQLQAQFQSLAKSMQRYAPQVRKDAAGTAPAPPPAPDSK